jgi:hypothetical protein
MNDVVDGAQGASQPRPVLYHEHHPKNAINQMKVDGERAGTETEQGRHFH